MGRINIELPDETHKKAKVHAAMRGITLITLVTEAIEEKLKREKK
ncbi:MAG: hypothetical protein QW594_03310 [Candidatus Woesearchaeota archaeon]